MHILQVEDNPGDARLVCELLRDEHGAQATFRHVTRIGDALDALSHEKFDAVLLDLALPDGSGMASVQRLLSNAPQIPVIILSGQDSEETALEAVRGGAEDYLVKGRVDGFHLFRALRYAIYRHQRTQRIAHHDPLTDLPNRLLFGDRLRQTILQSQRYELRIGLLFIDLDGFKKINDELGHDAGDEVLRSVARRAAGCLRKSDTLARLGGDEFTVILPSILVPDDGAEVSRKIIAALAPPIRLAQSSVSVGASIGISFYPLDAGDADALVRCADEAMYRAKAAGTNRYEFYRVDPAWASRPPAVGALNH